jgi:hypothetical protein
LELGQVLGKRWARHSRSLHCKRRPLCYRPRIPVPTRTPHVVVSALSTQASARLARARTPPRPKARLAWLAVGGDRGYVAPQSAHSFVGAESGSA